MTKFLKLYFNALKWTPTKSEWTSLVTLLTKPECDQIYRYVFKSDCKVRLISSLLMRYTIATLLEINWADVEIKRTDKGRPYCLNSRHVDFNTSHSGYYVIASAVLASLDEFSCKVGSDVMIIDKHSPKQLETYRRVMHGVFTPSEIDQIDKKANANEKLLEFNRLWALKESFVKATGDGIGFTLKRIDFHVKSPLLPTNATKNTCVFVDGSRFENVKFYEELVDDHVMTSCLLSESSANLSKYFDTCAFKELEISQIASIAVPIQFDTNQIDSYWTDYWEKPEKIGR
jgi:4'-phosphopantetheinyl transferase